MFRKFLCLALLPAVQPLAAVEIGLHESNFEHIHFRRIQPTTIRFDADTVRFEVRRSSSFLLLAFDEIQTISAVSFQWQADGTLNKVSKVQEKTRAGDDAWLRVGLIISGEPDPVPEPLLPRWVVQVRKNLKHPSDRMIYLIPGARHAPGDTWRSPYSPSIDMIAVDSSALDDGWQQARHVFPQAQQVVGLWIMADGDNTGSVFDSRLRKLVVE